MNIDKNTPVWHTIMFIFNIFVGDASAFALRRVWYKEKVESQNVIMDIFSDSWNSNHVSNQTHLNTVLYQHVIQNVR